MQEEIGFKEAPRRVVDGIPVFSDTSRYIENYERIADDYLKAIDASGDHPWIPPHLLVELEDSTRALVAKYAKQGDAVLDLGVGLGRILDPLTHIRRFGIDISLEYLRRIKSRGFQVAYARIEDIPYRPNSFDVLLAADVLEHVVNIYDVCERALAVLKPGGIWVIRVPFEEDLSPYLAENLPYEFIHLRNFDIPSLKILLCKLFKCEWLESVEVGHHYQGASRLRVHPPAPREKLSGLVEKFKPADRTEVQFLDRLKPALAMSEGELAAWVYEAREYRPRIYEHFASELVIPIEINVVIRKPPVR